MSIGLSLYLDLLRFFLAVTVMLCHGQSKAYTGNIFWRFLWAGQPAVIAFFVLSGFVIAFVTTKNELEPITYIVNRIARLYSVVIPCLALTALFDFVGWRIFPIHYLNAPMEIGTNHIELNYLAGFLMSTSMGLIGYITGDSFLPGTNGPFWSLSNELIYYILFGVWNFWRRRSILFYFILVAVTIIGGPAIMLLFPIWLMGLAAYRKIKTQNLNEMKARWIFFISLASFVLVGMTAAMPFFNQYILFSRPVILDYTVGILFAFNLFSAHGISSLLESFLKKYTKLIRWLGAMTFPLYLCHRPSIQFLSGFQFDGPGGLIQTAWVLGGTLMIAVLVTLFSDQFRFWIRRTLTENLPNYMKTPKSESKRVSKA